MMAAVVLRLVEPICGLRHHMYTDNLYTSPYSLLSFVLGDLVLVALCDGIDVESPRGKREIREGKNPTQFSG